MRDKIKKFIFKPIKGAVFVSTWSIIIFFIYLEIIKRALRKETHDSSRTYQEAY
jgi:hypothetical protein